MYSIGKSNGRFCKNAEDKNGVKLRKVILKNCCRLACRAIGNKILAVLGQWTTEKEEIHQNNDMLGISVEGSKTYKWREIWWCPGIFGRISLTVIVLII